MKREDWGWFWLALLLLPLLFVSRKDRDPMSRRKRWINGGAIALFVVFLLVVVIYKAVESKNQVTKAETTATEIAQGFAKNDPAVIDTWAFGEYVDPWEGQFILLENSHEKGVLVASKGPDGQLGTDDDVGTVVPVTYPKRIFIKPPEPKKKKEEVAKEEATGLMDKVKGFFK